MSFWTKLRDIAVVAAGIALTVAIPGSGLVATLAKSAVTSLVLRKVVSMISPSNSSSKNSNAGTRTQVNPDPTAHIPVIYGTATTGGIITDAQISDDQQTMYYCLTLSEKTGLTNLGAGPDSQFSFLKIYRNDLELTFDTDGITVISGTDRDGNVDVSMKGMIKVYCFANGGSNPTVPSGYTNGSLLDAYQRIPQWDINHTMDALVFAIVEVKYNSAQNVTDLGTFQFKMHNTLTQPGDCMYDYMTNTRYGGGILPQEIYSV